MIILKQKEIETNLIHLLFLLDAASNDATIRYYKIFCDICK